VQDYTTDPDNPITGQVWYNETANTIRVEAATTVGSWATGNNMNTGRAGMGSAGTYNTALGFGGYAPSSFRALTESYNGTNWTEVSDLNSARGFLAGAGTQTAALAFGGNPGPANESWNGSSWTELADLNTGRYELGGAGVSNTAALAFGGTGVTAVTESWNGSSWTEVADLNTARTSVVGNGPNTNLVAFGGSVPPNSALTESWNGSSWTEVGDLNTARRDAANCIGTDSTSALCAGGATPSIYSKC